MIMIFCMIYVLLQVDAAMANRPHIIDGKTVDPKRAVPREQSQRSEANISSKRLYVSGVREEHTEDMFKEHFGKYGNILKVFFYMYSVMFIL